MRTLAILTVRNEGAFLLEWLAHHKACGFTDVLVFSNDCDDGTDAMLDRLQALGQLTHVRNDGPHENGAQWEALKRADRHPLVQAADWILPLDIDEFVNIHVGDHSLRALFDALPEATAITLTWRLFGNDGIVEFTDTPVTEQFTRAAPAVMHGPWRPAMFKTLFRNDGTYRKLGVHRPRNPDPARVDQSRWFDGSGRPLSDQFRRNRLFSDYGRDNYRLVQLNHYALGAMESYILKSDRGRANREDGPLAMDYWVERNYACDTDDSIMALADRRRAFQSSLLADPQLAGLHDAAVTWRHKRFQDLMLHDGYRSLFARLLVTPSSRPLSAKAARIIAGHAMRARQIPAK